jgi:anti-sigma28 factor (negative regulator of flagellin synthesis)
MKVRNISDPSGSVVPSSDIVKNEPANKDVVAATKPELTRANAEAYTLSADFGSNDPAEAAKRAQRVQDLKAQNDAGTLKPATSSEIAKKLISELLI